MFGRRKRLARSDFATLSRGRRLHSTHFSVVIPHEGRGYAVVVSKKTARLSVDRHRLKRQVLAVLGSLTLPPSLVVFAKDSALGLSFGDIKTELATLLQ
jgi:ribonuclease P protein component